MKYSDLVKFEPIESVIQLLDANKADEGRRLVSSYVISDTMADRIADVIFPQLGFDPAVDHKGILVVGNYGTGKSHLMSVISTVAEDAGVVPEVRNDKVRVAAASIGGKFQVLRIEISSRMSLRDILVQELEEFLAARSVTFKFPPEDRVTQNKTALIEMMDAYERKFPGQGLLVVVDEMLDYLRSRRDTELVHDLSFMREIGEIAKNTRFRFIGGVQEAIFDSARFASTADSLRRVKDRFQQVLIDRQDIGFVVAERLLRKDEHQREAIRKHLEPFAKFYGNMGDRLEQFVRLFPVHPDYLAIFERIDFAENRNALSTLSGTMKKMLDQEVPSDKPGVITYDSFWTDVRTNPAFRAQAGVRDVVRIAETLQDKIETAFPKAKSLSRPTAHRIIDGLAIQRLTDDTAWDFIRTHLKNLAVVKRNKAGGMEMVAERDPRRLFDRMVAWFVRHNTPVPLSIAEFQAGLAERIPERDGMFFLPNQIDEYDKARMQAGAPPQRDLFVDDERTAIDWLTDFLKAKPSTYQEVHPDFTQKTGAGWRKHETKPELTRLLDENFLKYDGNGPVPSQIHAYLSSNWKELRNLDKDAPVLVEKARNRWFVPDPNKQQDVEARRDKALLREFEAYKAHKGRKMKEIRLEVMRVGFKAAWAAKDYRTIIDVSAKVPDEVWQEDERLMMLHSMAETRLQAER